MTWDWTAEGFIHLLLEFEYYLVNTGELAFRMLLERQSKLALRWMNVASLGQMDWMGCETSGGSCYEQRRGNGGKTGSPQREGGEKGGPEIEASELGNCSDGEKTPQQLSRFMLRILEGYWPSFKKRKRGRKSLLGVRTWAWFCSSGMSLRWRPEF